jgi:uncharacterized protein (TIGR03437 family)
MQYASPALLSLEGSSQGLISHSGTAELAAVPDVRSAGQPAESGDALTIRATGLGSGLRPVVRIGGIAAEVQSVSASAEATGAWDIRVTVPVGSEHGDQAPVQLEMLTGDGQLLQSNSVGIAIGGERR